MSQTILITGASSGIGKAAAHHFAAQGWNVIASMRQPEKEQELGQVPNIRLARLDVQDPATVAAAIAAGIAQFGAIDVLLNNAGFGQYGAFEAIAPAQIQAQFDVNVFGVMNTVRAILPHFRQRRAGLIINVSSGIGRFTLPMLSMYAASKFALEGFSEGLSYELLPLNIGVKIIEPGGVATAFHTRSNELFAANGGLTDYDAYAATAFGVLGAMGQARLSTAEEVAAVIYGAATDGTNTLRYVIAPDIQALFDARTNLPDQEYVNFMRKKFGLEA